MGPTILWLLSLLLTTPAVAAHRVPTNPASWQKGVSLGLFSEDPGWSYDGLLGEIAELGADHVQLVVALYQDNGTSTELFAHPRFTAPLATIRRAVRQAHRRGLAVLLFPIVRLLHPEDGEWRGTLAPRDRGLWMANYRRLLTGLGRLAAQEHVEALSIGSELSTLDTDLTAWRPLARALRQIFPGELVYSANFDHFLKTSIFDLTDKIGLCGYFSLATDGKPATDDELVSAWRRWRVALELLSKQRAQPLLFTEVGYLSQKGAAAWPWREAADEPVDLEEQTRCYRAFVQAWQDAPPTLLGGVYFWNWYGWGGPRSSGYTPRGKPAADVMRQFFRAPAAR